jgi:AraC-like DNA-binding protein
MKFFREHRIFRLDIKIHIVETEFKFFPAHWHPEIEIVMGKTGIIDIGFNFENYTLTPGDLMIIPGGNIHHYEMNGNGSVFIILFDPLILDKKSDGYSIPFIIKSHENTSFFLEIYRKIEFELMNNDVEYKNFIKLYLDLFSAWCIRCRTKGNIIKLQSEKMISLIETQKLFDYIENNYENKITLKMGAEILHFSVSHFCTYFKALTGTTFAKYVNFIRCQAAKNMLRTTDLKIIEISQQCGFENIRTFNREFKKTTEMTAKEYRCFKKI